jgi:hypothetical protein
MAHRQQGQAIVELALGMGALMLILAGLVAVSTVTAIELGLVAVAQEAAHTAALAATPVDAAQLGRARGLLVGQGYPLGNGSLAVEVDARQFGQGGQVEAAATYTVNGRDLFLFGLGSLTLSRQHAEPIGLHRSLP